MKIKTSLLGLLLCAGAAHAGLTSIAQVPLLNIKGTGAVKPNLMLVYDNSGSMDFEFTPDIIAYKGGNSNVCRSAKLLSTRQRNCAPGDPPYNSPDLNKQYYNPAIRYTPPVNADGSNFNVVSYGNVSPWDKVRNDGFDSSAGTINLATSFPDLKWCDSNNANCVYNTAAYTYPSDTLYKGNSTTSNPYYYRINTAEYCTTANLTDPAGTSCATVAVGAPAPAGKPFPAKVRWCVTTDLDTKQCQAKVDKTHIYPRFSTPGAAAVVGFGTITIGSTSGTSSQSIASVSVNELGTDVVITNGAVAAPSGTNSNTTRAQLANDLAASIIAKSGLANQYGACVRTPSSGSTVPTCSSQGITLATDYIVAVIPLDCLSGATNKNTQCAPLADDSRSGWTLTATMLAAPPTALITVSGTSGSVLSVPSVSLGGTALFGASASPSTTVLTFSSGNKNASTVASGIVGKIGAAGSVAAYIGGSTITPVCKNASSAASVICLVDTASTVNGKIPAVGALTNPGSTAFAYANTAGYDPIPLSTTPLSAGNAIFVRTDIVSGKTYPKDPNRIDCVGAACTYTEEMTNFANWYIFYRSRNQMMKTAVGQAFAPLSSNYRVGLALLRETNSGSIAMTPQTFSGTNRSTWYTTLYAATASSGTPLRNAVHKVATMFATTTGVVTELCQPNFMLVTTDGYWNGNPAADVTNNDNKEDASHFCTRAGGCLDPTANTTNTLADIALYWYNGGSNGAPVSLVSGLHEDMTKEGTVPGRDGENKHLHINTYTLGLGVDGLMTYDPNYDKPNNLNGDFSKILAGVQTGCPWTADGKYNWPDAHTEDQDTDYQSRVDDLWHAAVNGRGKYFAASVPDEVVAGLTSALSNMQAVIGAASAAATSTPNISQQDNDIFSDTYTTVKWYGELSAQKIDINDGSVGSTSTWITSATIGKHVFASTDERKIYMTDTATAKTLKNFTYSAMNATEKGWFDNKCALMSQCTTMSDPEKVTANNGSNLVNWLRGQQQYADDNIYRAYASYQPNKDVAAIPIVLGDIASSKPAYLRDPRKAYTLTGYAKYKSDNTAPTVGARKAMVYTAANDGMLHAFDAATGEEQWAYAPRITMKKLAAQASVNYASNHQFTTDGSPELGDIQIGGVWKTVLVAGLGAGGRGYYALDVTDPLNPVALWEMCADSTLCALNDPNIGLTFGNPQFGMWNGKWVVYLTSGYNNTPGVDGVSTGDGKGHLYIVNAATGAIELDVSTAAGDTATPSGLAKITAISANPATDPVTTYIYGGDNQGQMWRFNLTDKLTFAVTKIMMANAGALQPVTTRPDVSTCEVIVTGGDGKPTPVARRVVLFGTGRLLDTGDMKTTDVQSLYLLKDLDGATGNQVGNLPSTTMVKQVLKIQDAAHPNNYLVSANGVDLATKNGWYINWDINSGERMNLDPKIVNGGVNVVTNIPGESSACSVGGSSNVYQVGLCTGSMPSPEMLAGTTLSSSSAAVGFIIVRLPSGKLKMISTLADGKKLTKEVKPFTTLGARKVGWRRITN